MQFIATSLLTAFKNMNETHEQRSQLLAVKRVLLLHNVHFDPSARNIVK